jgi:hypothetical protein
METLEEGTPRRCARGHGSGYKKASARGLRADGLTMEMSICAPAVTAAD